VRADRWTHSNTKLSIFAIYAKAPKNLFSPPKGTNRGEALSDTMTVCYVNQIKLAIKSCYPPLKYAGHIITAVVAQLVEALRYKPEGRGFDSRRYNWNFSLIESPSGRTTALELTQAPRNEYQEHFLEVKAASK
jgi:hypothetical protein